MSCELRVGDKSHTGVVLDVSVQGLFVRTNLQPPAGSRVELTLRRPGGEVWAIVARVARQVPRAGSAPSTRGLGLEIEEAPEAYHALVHALARGDRER